MKIVTILNEVTIANGHSVDNHTAVFEDGTEMPIQPADREWVFAAQTARADVDPDELVGKRGGRPAKVVAASTADLEAAAASSKPTKG